MKWMLDSRVGADTSKSLVQPHSRGNPVKIYSHPRGSPGTVVFIPAGTPQH